MQRKDTEGKQATKTTITTLDFSGDAVNYRHLHPLLCQTPNRMSHADMPSLATAMNEQQASVISIKHSAMAATVIFIILHYRKPLCPPQINDLCIS